MGKLVFEHRLHVRVIKNAIDTVNMFGTVKTRAFKSLVTTFTPLA